MPDTITIALDAMGGDLGPAAVIPGAAEALKTDPNLKFILFGRQKDIETQLNRYPALRGACLIHHTEQVIANDEKPAQALRQGRESSMRKAIDAVADGRAACVVSSGNTGALMATAKVVLKMLPGIHRPAIASVFPSQKGQVVMLDLGANLTCDPEMLVQFAILGTVYARAIRGIERPTVGLLNVGSEEMKGHDELRAAAAMLQGLTFPGKFYGFIEGNDIPLGTTDVVVTDGFTGNVALKVAEGVGKLTGSFIKQAFKSSPLAMIGALFASGALRRLKHRVDPRLYNGGMFLGLNGICVKSHGGSDAVGFSRAVLVAADLVRKGYNLKVAKEIEAVMGQESFVTPAIPDEAA
jgi:phosphate acyltransferase